MPFNGSGTFNRLRNWVSDATAGIKIRADYHDQEDDGFAAGLSNCITKDGQTQPVGNIPLAGFRLINVGNPVNDQDAITKLWAESNIVAGAHVADAPPATAKVGNLWWDSDSGNLFVKYDDGSSVQWVQVNVAAPQAYLSGPFKRTVFTANSTSFQFDLDTHYADIEVQGGGGGGGGSGSVGSANTASAGSGGGGGGCAKKLITLTPAIRAATKTITIGNGGAGGSTGASAPGQNSSYSDGTNTLTGNGGAAGTQGVFATQVGIRAGGAPGGSAGGDINFFGQPGNPGFSFGSTPNGAGSASASAGNGGASPLGTGGTGPCYFSSAVAAGSLGNGGQRGGGGSGAAGILAVSPALAGGGGGDGIVVITEYR